MLTPGYLKYRTIEYGRNMALQRGWSGHQNYTRFLIVGRSRVGSNLLRGLLNAHNQVVVLGEIFQNKNEIGWAMEGFPTNGRTKEMFLHQPVSFLEQKAWRHFPEQVTAVGFKLFYYHARDPEWSPVWAHLAQDPALHVLHLKRRNLLEVYLSRQRALLSQEWVSLGGTAPKIEAISLDYDACLADFEQTRAWEQEADTFFAHQTVLELIYEELVADPETEMRRVQEFLDVDYSPVQPETQKQRQRPLADAIVNYDELKAQFAASPWANFFED